MGETNQVYAMQKVALGLYYEKEKWPRDVIQDLTDLLQHEDTDTVYSAIYVLSVIGEPATDAVPSITKCLRHKEWSVRYRAAIDLRSFGSSAREAIPVLREALNDQEERVRREAKLTLDGLRLLSSPK
jgi:HEAT repeat protein